MKDESLVEGVDGTQALVLTIIFAKCKDFSFDEFMSKCALKSNYRDLDATGI